MKFALAMANTGPFTDPAAAVDFARAAEGAGFESIWTVEHVVVPAGYRAEYPYDKSGRMPGPEDTAIPDPLIWLAFLASATTTLRLGTGVLILPQRNPVVLAKETATLDHLSGGRLMLGIGSGWLEEEFDAIGVPFAERGRRTDDAVGALRALWSDDQATYEGEFASFRDCIVRPQPIDGSIPVHVGGHTPVAARRAGRLGDGFFPMAGDHERLAELFAMARSAAEEHGRDPEALEMTTAGRGVFGPGAMAEIEALRSLGVDRVIVPAFLFFRNPGEDLARYGEDVIARSQT